MDGFVERGQKNETGTGKIMSTNFLYCPSTRAAASIMDREMESLNLCNRRAVYQQSRASKISTCCYSADYSYNSAL